MNVTFDTNILVSGFEFPTGRAKRALEIIDSGRDALFISQPIIDELLRVLADKFNWSTTRLGFATEWIDQNCHVISPTETLSVLADEPVNRILECALAADADVIVTGDRAMLDLGRIGSTRIITLAEYLRGVDNPSINS